MQMARMAPAPLPHPARQVIYPKPPPTLNHPRFRQTFGKNILLTFIILAVLETLARAILWRFFAAIAL